MTTALAPPRTPLMTAAQVAARLHIEAGDVTYLPSYRIGRRASYDMAELAAWGQTPTGRSLLSILRTKPPGTPWWRSSLMPPGPGGGVSLNGDANKRSLDIYRPSL